MKVHPNLMLKRQVWGNCKHPPFTRNIDDPSTPSRQRVVPWKNGEGCTGEDWDSHLTNGVVGTHHNFKRVEYSRRDCGTTICPPLRRTIDHPYLQVGGVHLGWLWSLLLSLPLPLTSLRRNNDSSLLSELRTELVETYMGLFPQPVEQYRVVATPDTRGEMERNDHPNGLFTTNRSHLFNNRFSEDGTVRRVKN